MSQPIQAFEHLLRPGVDQKDPGWASLDNEILERKKLRTAYQKKANEEANEKANALMRVTTKSTAASSSKRRLTVFEQLQAMEQCGARTLPTFQNHLLHFHTKLENMSQCFVWG